MRRMRRKRREQKIKVANKTVSSSERVRAIRRTASRLSQQPGSTCECARVNWRKRIIQFERCLISPLISSSANLTASSCDARVKFIHSFRSHLLITLWLPIFIIYVYARSRARQTNRCFIIIIYFWPFPHAKSMAKSIKSLMRKMRSETNFTEQKIVWPE